MLLVLLAGMVYLAVLPVRIYFAGLRDETMPADVIIVLGARQNNGKPSGALQARLDHGLTLYRHARVPYLLFTGGRRKGDVYTEAGTGRRYALEHGVPESVILLEPDGRTTMQSLQACQAIMQQHGLRRAILVSDPYHAFRLRRMVRDLGMQAVVSPTPMNLRNRGEVASRLLHETEAYAAYRFFGI